jgi:ankyrin repeat protein
LLKGADVNTKAKDGLTALIWAAYYGDNDIVKVLLANTADVNANQKNGFTAVMAAKKKGYKEIVRILKEARAKE